MAILFYILGWLAVLAGAAVSSYAIYNDLQTADVALSSAPTLLKYATGAGLSVALPSLWLVFWGLVLLTVASVLSLLAQIEYNLRD